MEVKACPDGTSVGRIPPDCEFAPCPYVTGKYITLVNQNFEAEVDEIISTFKEIN